MGAFTKLNLLEGIKGTSVDALPQWIENWASTRSRRGHTWRGHDHLGQQRRRGQGRSDDQQRHSGAGLPGDRGAAGTDHRAGRGGAALGAQYGALSVLTPVATADAVPAERFGTSYGMVFSGWGAAGLAGPVAAAVASHAGHRAVIGTLAAVGLLAWGAVVWVTRRLVSAS